MRDERYTGVDNLEVLADAVRYNRFLVEAVVEVGAECTTAVDFGAGTGTLSVDVRSKGLSVTCVEPDPGLRERLRENGFEVFDDASAIPHESQAFVYSINVLEHIEDDRGAMAALFTILKPGGRLLLYVPALNILFSSMDRKIGHFRRYRRKDLAQLARRVGFEIERCEYADSMVFFAALLYKMIGSRRGDVSPRGLKIYDRYVFPLSCVLDRMGGSKVFGKNLVAILRRPGETSA